MRDEMNYQRGALMQQKKKLHQYVAEASHRINGQQLQSEQLSKSLNDKAMELEQRESMLEQEKKEFDAMCRRFNQKKINDELKNAEQLSRRMLEIEKKERK